MNINLVLVLLIIGIIIYKILFQVEKFVNTPNNDINNHMAHNNTVKPNENSLEGSNINENTDNEQCIINRVIEGNKFVYKYNVNKDDTKCYDDMNQRCIKTGDIIDSVPFKMDKCGNGNLGSCRKRGGFECVDFKSKNDCSEYNMEWSERTCAELLERDIKYPENISSIM
jgi:hypothetical protein